MHRNSSPNSPSRRTFLAATSGFLAAAAAGPLSSSAVASPRSSFNPLPEGAKKIPIGVFDAAFPKLSLDEMLDKYSAWGVEAAEIGTGGYPNSVHCQVQELLDDPAKLRAWKKKFEDHNVRVATLSCHGNPVHPDGLTAFFAGLKREGISDAEIGRMSKINPARALGLESAPPLR